MSYYTNGIGRIYWMPEPPLEPPDCLLDGGTQRTCEEEYDRAEDELNGIFNRSKAASCY